MLRRVCAAFTVLLLAAPGVAASTMPPGDSLPFEDPPSLVDAAPPESCLAYDVSIPDAPARAQGRVPLGCDPEDGHLVWNGRELEGEGSLELRLRRPPRILCADGDATFDGRFDDAARMCRPHVVLSGMSSDVTPVDTSLQGVLRRWLEGSSEPAPPEDDEAPSGYVVQVRFRAAWGFSDCARTQGTFEARVNGGVVAREAPHGFLASLCHLSRGPDVGSAHVAASVAVLVLGIVSGATPTLAAPSAPAAPGVAVEPADSPDVLAAGDALVRADPETGVLRAEGDLDAQAGARVEAQAIVEPAPPPAAEAASVPSRAAIQKAPPATPHGTSRDAPPARQAPSVSAFDPLPALRPDAPTPAPSPQKVQVLHARGRDDAALPLAAGGIAASVLALLGFALYQRIARPAALGHAGRQALHEACLRRQAGGTAGELAQDVGMDRKTAEYHLVYLVRAGLLREGRNASGRRVFASAAAPREAFGAPLPERVLDLVRARPGASMQALVDAAGATRNRVDRCVKDLLVEGRLQAGWDGRARVFFLGR